MFSAGLRSDLPVKFLQTLIRETMIKLPLKPALNKHAVNARFSFLTSVGFDAILWSANRWNWTLEKELVMAVKWLKFISFFSKGRWHSRRLTLYLYWLRFLNSPTFLFAVSTLGVLVGLAVVYFLEIHKLK